MVQLLPRACVSAALLAAPATAQLNVGWVEFSPADVLLDAPDGVSAANAEVDFAVADLDRDGWSDVVVARRGPWTLGGSRTNRLLRNDAGTLVDETSSYAAASDVVGDAGFLTATSDRDVVVVDVDGDGWEDLVTAAALTLGFPKHLGHPRVYRNLGAAPGGGWRGLLHEDARIPQLLHLTSGTPQNPNFLCVAAGDLNQDGSPDLYFGDSDLGGGAGALDMNNRTLANVGGGGFFDDYTALQNPAYVTGGVTTSAVVADFNGNGAGDVVTTNPVFAPSNLAIDYTFVFPGVFQNRQVLDTSSPGHVSAGDLNRDGRLDLLVSADFADSFFLNLGDGPANEAIWSPKQLFDFFPGSGDDGFAGNNAIVDLDGDGWSDAIVCDVEFDIAGFDRRIHVYHNRGGLAGGLVELGEEREVSSDLGWVGARGFSVEDLEGGYDVAPLDLDNDGDVDLVFGRGAGTNVWVNQTVPNPAFAVPSLQTNVETLSISAGGTQTYQMDGGAELADHWVLLLGSTSGTAPGLDLGGGVVLPLAVDAYFLYTLSSPNQPPYLGSLAFVDLLGEGTAHFVLPPGVAPASLLGVTLHHAFAAIDVLGGTGVTFASNAAPLTFVP